jgi:sensor histidine kinase regulating citrate/malate metabolism
MDALREQTESDKKHRRDMDILRHDMRHEMGLIMELFRNGKSSDAEAVYADWQNALADTITVTLCAEPVLNAVFTRFERKASDKNIRLQINSSLPDTLPIDTIKFSVVVSNALENALSATDLITVPDRRIISVKLIQNGSQLGLEVANPCDQPVAFDDRGYPGNHRENHGIGVRSISAFAEDNGYLLNFTYDKGCFLVRLVMDFPMAE